MICAECGHGFGAKRQRKFCSDRCRYKHRDARPHRRDYDRRRHRERRQADIAAPTGWHNARATAEWYGVEYEDFDKLEIFERDGWSCGICGGGIPKELNYPDPESASIDHIVPWSRGGSHTRANTQAAHLRCNQQKGAQELRMAS